MRLHLAMHGTSESRNQQRPGAATSSGAYPIKSSATSEYPYRYAHLSKEDILQAIVANGTVLESTVTSFSGAGPAQRLVGPV